MTIIQLKELCIGQAWFSTCEDAQQIMEEQDRFSAGEYIGDTYYWDAQDEPYASMSREELFEELRAAGEAEDPRRWNMIAETIRDGMTKEELELENKAKQHTIDIMTRLRPGRWDFDELINVMAMSCEFVDLVEASEWPPDSGSSWGRGIF